MDTTFVNEMTELMKENVLNKSINKSENDINIVPSDVKGNDVKGEITNDDSLEENSEESIIDTNDMTGDNTRADFDSEKLCSDVGLLIDNVKIISEGVNTLSAEMNMLKSQLGKLDVCDRALETLKRSLAANINNENNIHKELEVYKKNQYFSYIRPFMEFIIGLLVDISESRKQYINDRESIVGSYDEKIYEEIINLHTYYIQQLTSQLQIQGVEIVSYEENSDFIATEQMISKTVSTDNKELTGKISTFDVPCFKYEDKILRKAKVQVYKYIS